MGDLGSIPGLGRSPGEGQGYPLQYSGLENSIDCGVAKSRTRLSSFHFHFTCFLRNLYAGQVATELDMEQQTGSKLGKEYLKAVYCHPAYLTYLHNTSGEMLGWMKHKLESRLLGEIITSDMRMIPPLWQKAKRLNRLDESEREE